MTSALVLVGAAAFGFVIGWYVYYVNRYRTGDVQLTDLVTLIGAIGGAAILKLFPSGTDLFGAYGIGLLLGFLAYFLVLIGLIGASIRGPGDFNWEWFLDGRRRNPQDPWGYPSAQQVRPPLYRVAGLAPAAVKDISSAADIKIAGAGDAGSWQSVDGQDVALRVTIKNTGDVTILGIAYDGKGMQRGVATAGPGTSTAIGVSAVSRVVFSCQGAGRTCAGTWTVDPIL